MNNFIPHQYNANNTANSTFLRALISALRVSLTGVLASNSEVGRGMVIIYTVPVPLATRGLYASVIIKGDVFKHTTIPSIEIVSANSNAEASTSMHALICSQVESVRDTTIFEINDSQHINAIRAQIRRAFNNDNTGTQITDVFPAFETAGSLSIFSNILSTSMSAVEEFLANYGPNEFLHLPFSTGGLHSKTLGVIHKRGLDYTMESGLILTVLGVDPINRSYQRLSIGLDYKLLREGKNDLGF